MSKPTLIDRGNATNNPCLLLLRSKGYDVRVNCYRYKRDNSVECLYFASKEGVSFSGLSGAEVLGLATLWEAFGEDWNRQEPDVIDEVISTEEVDNDEGNKGDANR